MRFNAPEAFAPPKRSALNPGFNRALWTFPVLQLALFVAFCGLLPFLASCKDQTCRGVMLDGKCTQPCDDNACSTGERCLNDHCTPTCSNDNDCASGRCERQRADKGGSARFCTAKGTSTANDAGVIPSPSPTPTPGSTGSQCSINTQCTTARGERCVEGLCRLTCRLHDHCGPAGSCSDDARDVEGNPVILCRSDSFPRGPGQFGSTCIDGNQDCDLESGFRCLSVGEGDVDARCTRLGCDGDDSCPMGYFCSGSRTPRSPCSTACGVEGSSLDPQCIPLSDIGPGRPYQCAEGGGLRLHLCLRRDYCVPCDSDADCRAEQDQVCAQGPDGVHACTKLCNPQANDCPWGSASQCQVWDPDLGQPTCGHRAGTCRGTGSGCEPCVDDRDCPTGLCTQNRYTQERFCVDLELTTCSCPAGNDMCSGGGCPLTPSGLTMLCVPRTETGRPDTCYGARTIPGDETSPLGCWPQ